MARHERALAQRFSDAGYAVLLNGWPDLLVERDGRIVAYEVKGPGDTLRPNQERMHAALRRAGIVVETIDENAAPWLRKKEHSGVRG